MLDVADLEVNILEFHGKNFAFERLAPLAEDEFAIFTRTETESEAKLRPKLVRLRVVVPRAWVLFDLAADLLVFGQDGKTPGARSTEAAIEAAAEKGEFKEQGIAWRRTKLADGGFAYVPEAYVARLIEGAGLGEIGIR